MDSAVGNEVGELVGLNLQDFGSLNGGERLDLAPADRTMSADCDRVQARRTMAGGSDFDVAHLLHSI
jgi:hypothetical protein